MRQHGIRRYVAWLTLVPLSIIAVCLETFFLHHYFSELDRHVIERGKLIASQLASSSEYGVVSNNQPFLQSLSQRVVQQPDVRGLRILNSKSITLAELGGFTTQVKIALAEIREAATHSMPSAINYNDESLLIYQPIIPESVTLDEFEPAHVVNPVGAVILEISLARTEKLKSQILWTTISVTAAFLALVGYLVYLASRHITRPISMLSNAVQTIAKGDLSTRTDQHHQIYELDELSGNINKMAQQLQENQEMLEQRIVEATRELREKIGEVELAHSELRKSEDRYRTLYTSTPVMLHSIDTNGVIVSVSDYWLTHMGYERNEVIGKKSSEFLTEVSRQLAVEKVLPEFLKTGICQDVNYQFIRKDGSVVETLLSAIAERDHEGHIIRSLAVVLDITERRQAQDALQSAKVLAERANLSKSRFLAAASHDLRQPIHALSLFLGVLSRSGLTEQQRELLANARAASVATNEMLNTLLDFSRIEAGVVTPQMQTFRLQPLLNKIENELAPQADEKNIVYRTRETPLIVHSDPALVELILRNLVSNAIRYTTQGGLLVGCRKHGSTVILEVWDTGIGIAPENQQEVFREFHQLGNPERDRQKGLGLGLAISEGMARALGHELSLASTPQRGSVFRLALPLATELPGEECNLTQHIRTTQMLHVRVLVIDDDASVRAGMDHLLRDWGCEVDTAEYIEQALSLASANAPDVIISDYRLREQRTGLEAIVALREFLGSALPALLITADTAQERLLDAQAQGIPLLPKPASPGQLYLALVKVLDQTGSFSA